MEQRDGSVTVPHDGQPTYSVYFRSHNYGANWHDGNEGRESWWTFPMDLDMVELGARVAHAFDDENYRQYVPTESWLADYRS